MYNRRQTGEFDGDDKSLSADESLFSNRQLLVVSNRQPYRHESDSKSGDITVDRPTGGLTASLDPTMQRTGGTWIAWGDGSRDRDVVDETDCIAVPPDDPKYTLRRVWLSDEQIDGYYYGFSNQILWPLCHASLATMHAERSYWEQYKKTNQQFAEIVADEAGEHPIIWLQDYHFGLAPRMVRQELGPDPIIMQFWHIPWPSWDVFRACPYGENILKGLLGNDVLGFHVDRYVTNFIESVDAALNEATVDWQSKSVSYQGAITRIESIPMGVPVNKIRSKAASYGTSEYKSFKESHGIDEEMTVAIGVDRLDYSKGIPERLRALETFWKKYPEWRESITYIQNCSESRSQIDAYAQLQSEVEEAVARINERFGSADWQPIIQSSEYLSQRELYGLYRHADIAIVSPVRDGMNLVAEEFAAAQLEQDGVLVLSTETGAHDVFGEHVLSVSPYEVEEFADQLHVAVGMSPEEREFRMEHIRRKVAVNDLQTWLQKNESLAQAVEHSRRQLSRKETPPQSD